MAEKTESALHPITPYGVAIHEAVASNDLERMKRTRDQAQAWLKHYGDVGKALEALEKAISEADKA